MTRTIISLDVDTKSWLDQRSANTGVSMSELVRKAIRLLKEQEENAFNNILGATSGTWTQGDGLKYQQSLRGEWDRA